MSVVKDVIWSNIDWNVRQVRCQLKHASQVKGRARGRYYQVAILFASAIVEALMHELLKNRLRDFKDSDLLLGDWRHGETYELPAGVMAKAENIVFCKRTRKQFELTKHTDFRQVNIIAKKLGFIDDDIFNRVEKIREKRNTVHLQGLDSTQQNWNVKTLGRVMNMFGVLLDKVKK